MANVNHKEEELKKLLVSVDFKEDTYKDLTVQDVIILKNSAETMKEKNTDSAQNRNFFEKREEFFLHLLMRRMQQMNTLYCLFAKATNLPYVVCDPDSANDQIWLFSDEKFAQKAVMVELQNKRELFLVKLENKQFLSFYTGLYAMGVNAFVMDRGMNSVEVELEKLVKRPDFSKIPEAKRPLQNPELVLTGAYFAQERVMPEDKRDDETLHDLEEEMLVNLVRGKVMIPIMVPEGKGAIDPKDMRVPYMKLKNGDMYQPVCADVTEFQRFNKDNKMRAIIVDFEKLKGTLAPNVKGIMLNPVTLRLAIPSSRIR